MFYYLKSYFSINRLIPISWVKKDKSSWLSTNFIYPYYFASVSKYSKDIEFIAAQTNKLGEQSLWKGYGENDFSKRATRMPNNVRTSGSLGNLYTHIVVVKKPEIIVEFGTAFGVSGMFFLAGIEQNQKGKLLTFEPNLAWSKIAERNLSRISNRFQLTNDCFESSIDLVLEKKQVLDIAFIDAIHTREFVIPQLDICLSRSKSGTLIIIMDDINFSQNMSECWNEVSHDSRFSSSLSFGKRVGVLDRGSVETFTR